MKRETYKKGQSWDPEDLGILMLESPAGKPVDLGVVTYVIYSLDFSGNSVERITPMLPAINSKLGNYYIEGKAPEKEGMYRVVWFWKEGSESGITPKIITDFQVRD